jgi:hypothetical protein
MVGTNMMGLRLEDYKNISFNLKIYDLTNIYNTYLCTS